MAQEVINLGTGPDTPGSDSRYTAFTKTNNMFTELYVGPVPQVAVAAGQTLAVTRAAHQGATIVLGDAGATISFSATTQGDGFVFKVINRTGAAWTVPAFAGGTHHFETAGHTKVSALGSAAIETYTHGGTRYVHVAGTTE